MKRWKNHSEGVVGGDRVTETFVEDETNEVLGSLTTVYPPNADGSWITVTFMKGHDPETQNFSDLEAAKAAVESAVDSIP